MRFERKEHEMILSGAKPAEVVPGPGGYVRAFISQPMRGRDTEDILRERRDIMGYLPKYLNREVVEVESFFGENRPESPLACLAESIGLLATADVAVFAKGWDDARGCRIEHDCAEEYGIPVLEAF